MSYVQQLQGPDIRSDFNFGASIDFRNSYIYVGVSRDDGNTPAGLAPGGSVYEFKNTTGTQGWDLIRYNEPRTNVNSVSKMYLYNKKTQRIVTSVDIYDPVKGKILGIAEQDLDFKSEFDPASYNDSASSDNGYINFNSNYYWGPDQVGKTWWDLSQVRFLDYEQDSLEIGRAHV